MYVSVPEVVVWSGGATTPIGTYCSTHTHRLSPTLWVAELDGAFVGKMGGHNEGGLMALLLYMTFRGGSVHCTGTYACP